MAEKPGKQKQSDQSESSETKSRDKVRVRSAVKSAEKERLTEAAKRFKALGEPTRLRILLFLKEQWEAEQAGVAQSSHSNGDGKAASHFGARITDICQKVNGAEKISSTFSHHIKELRRAGLIRVERDGKNRWCQIEPEVLTSLHPFLGLSLQNITPSTPTDPVLGSNGTEGAEE